MKAKPKPPPHPAIVRIVDTLAKIAARQQHELEMRLAAESKK